MRDRTFLRLFLLLLLSFALAAATGCGDDDDDGGGGGDAPATQTAAEDEEAEDEAAVEEFQDEVEEVCEDFDATAGTEFAETFRSYADPQSDTQLPDVVRATDSYIEAIEDQLEELGDLEAPASLEDQVTEYVESFDDLLEGLRDFRDLAEQRSSASTTFRQDLEALQEEARGFDVDRSEFDDLAEEIGAEECEGE